MIILIKMMMRIGRMVLFDWRLAMMMILVMATGNMVMVTMIARCSL